MAECRFCEIVAGRSPVSTFYEDEVVLGLMTKGPVTEGHAMVIPKEHAAYLADLDEETGRHLWTVAQRTAAAIRECGVQCEGINLFLADGEAAFQEIFHVHMHVFPRYKATRSSSSLTGITSLRERNLIVSRHRSRTHTTGSGLSSLCAGRLTSP